MSRFRLVKSYPALGYLFRPWIVSNGYQALAFLIKHRRWPNFNRTGYLNDLLFRIRAIESDIVFRSFTSDKEYAKIFVRGLIGEDLCVPTLAVLRDAGEVERFVFPDDCVIKPTHMSNEVTFHESGAISDGERARMLDWLKMNFADMTGERNYQKLQPKIIVEPWLKLNGALCHDYRFHMYRGQLTSVGIRLRHAADREETIQLTSDWRQFPGRSLVSGQISLRSFSELEALKPAQLSKMMDVARQIARFADYVRVDFFTDGGEQLFVGEISHITAGANERFDPVELERLFTKPSRHQDGPVGALAESGANSNVRQEKPAEAPLQSKVYF